MTECPHCGFSGDFFATGVSTGAMFWQRCNRCRKDFDFQKTEISFTVTSYGSLEEMMAVT